MRKSRLPSAASLTIHDAAIMTPAGRRRIAKWLMNQADNLINDGKMYSARFTARYMYDPKK